MPRGCLLSPQVTQPFTVLPRATLEGGCNSVLNTFSPMIMRLFLSKLADDYARWSTDEAYRCLLLYELQRHSDE